MAENIYDKETEHEKIEHYDVLILGAGPAGLTAALYSGRYNLKTAVIAKTIGGTANLAGEIENWPGFKGSGMELMQKFRKQAEEFGARFIETEVADVEKDENGFIINIKQHSKEKVIHGKTLIIALGTEHRKLSIENEKELLGKGVSYCATCDGMFFKNKTTAVVGGADSAAKAALYLSDIAKKVYIIYRKNEMRCEPISLQKINKKDNIEIFYHSTPTKLVKDEQGKLKSVKISQETDNSEKEISLEIDGLFIEIGAVPVIEIVKNLNIDVDKKGYIITDKDAKTSLKDAFAAGDATNNNLKQVVTASAEGAIAAKSAHEYLKINNP